MQVCRKIARQIGRYAKENSKFPGDKGLEICHKTPLEISVYFRYFGLN